jgi:hypothetical protein
MSPPVFTNAETFCRNSAYPMEKMNESGIFGESELGAFQSFGVYI